MTATRQLGFNDLLASADADNHARQFERRTAHLPGTAEEALPFFRDLLERHNAAMSAGDVVKTMRMRDEAHDLAQKLNGGEPGILAHDDAPGRVLERETAATPGMLPLWGQAGEFVVTVGSMRVRIVMEGVFGTAAVLATGPASPPMP